MTRRRLRLASPSALNRGVRSERRSYRALRTCKYLTEDEVERLMAAARDNRRSLRNLLMILMAYRHDLRASELTRLRWDHIDFEKSTLHVRRVKQGAPNTHPILGDVLRALQRLKSEQKPRSAFLFISERGAPLSTAGFARMIERAGKQAKFGFKAHPHMLRHACGYKLANDGQNLGHKNVQHTVRHSA